MIVLAQIFDSRNHCEIVPNMKTADVFAVDWHNVVYMPLNVCHLLSLLN